MTQMRAERDAAGPAASREGKYLTFRLAEEDYGVGILAVREIIGMMRITPVPQTPAYVKGVLNLRGQVIPVVDLRMKFGMSELNYTERTSIIVVEIKNSQRRLPIGLVVDAVSEVANIRAEDIEDSPSFTGQVDTAYILGMAKVDGGVKILLDIDMVLNGREIQEIEAAA